MWLMKLFFCRKLNNKLSFLLALALTLLAIVMFTVNVILYKSSKIFEEDFIKSYLTNQLSCIQSLMLQDVQNILENKNPEHLMLIKNFQYLKDSTIYENGMIGKIYTENNNIIVFDFSSVFELIDGLAKENFMYYIELNGKILNSSMPEETYDIVANGHILSNNFSIKLKVLQNSLIKLESKKRIRQEMWYRIVISSVMFCFLCYIILKHYQNIIKIKTVEDNTRNLIKFYKEEKADIVKRYEYTRRDLELLERLESAGLIHDTKTKNYFPIFLSQQVNENKIYSLDLQKLNLSSLVDSYNLINNSDIELQVDDRTSDNQVDSLLENEVLSQLFESIVRNFLQLKRNSKEKGVIKITYFSNGFTFECNLVKLNKDHLIKWSKSLFDNTGNPFILDFYQIFKILEIFYCKTEVGYKDEYLILDIKFDLDSMEVKQKYTSNVIDITNKYRKK
jgi:hypothetical protein